MDSLCSVWFPTGKKHQHKPQRGLCLFTWDRQNQHLQIIALIIGSKSFTYGAHTVKYSTLLELVWSTNAQCFLHNASCMWIRSRLAHVHPTNNPLSARCNWTKTTSSKSSWPGCFDVDSSLPSVFTPVQTNHTNKETAPTVCSHQTKQL